MVKKLGFDRVLFRRFCRILRILFPRFFCRTALLFYVLLLLGILGEVIGYQVGIVPSRFYSVLGKKDKDGFYWTFLEASLYILGSAIVLSSKQYVASVMYICWRKLLTKKLQRMYFNDKSYYTLNVLDKTIDNPDQRITQDVNKMCDTLSTIIATVIIAPFRIGYYSYKSFITTTYIGPLSIFGYFIIGTIASKLLMSPVINFVAKQERKEGDFRFKHMQIRANAESLAFYDSGNFEENRLNLRLHTLLAVQLLLTNLRLALNFFLNFYNYFGGILCHLIISIPIFAGYYDYLSAADLAALISANAFVSIYLISSFTVLVDLSTSITDIGGTAHRIGQLLENLSIPREFRDDLTSVQSDGESALQDIPDESTLFRLHNVEISPPNTTNELLVAGLTMSVREKETILISGPSSCGKSSLLRVLAELWPIRSGRIDRQLSPPVHPTDVLFLPQKPYFTDGSLWQQVAFPLGVAEEIEPEESVKVSECLRQAGAERLLERVKSVDEMVDWNWYDVLSPGEMQRLAFARVFYHRPRMAFLDEATSAVSMDVEEELYATCAQLGITYVSVGHRITLRNYHDALLELDGRGGFSFKKSTREPDQ
ncbi:lysosomal cobalamin transporter ABCD4-like [Paramacrobiotus metropolitanus]|uniref:lysosomal cobalamin transporter ABCD4-like n=1 Tax=Paramacrobiotus metropolitanus TaxID=2943436 RepID=UPI002445C3C9|nr:lysosomal cobalamin transporter ABCD4-like [Paramacrobiotus metropolitanus]